MPNKATQTYHANNRGIFNKEGEQVNAPTQTLREEISKTLIKWSMPTRQAAITELVRLFESEIKAHDAEMRELIEEMMRKPKILPHEEKDEMCKRCWQLKKNWLSETICTIKTYGIRDILALFEGEGK